MHNQSLDLVLLLLFTYMTPAVFKSESPSSTDPEESINE